jgi:hypothetical protein
MKPKDLAATTILMAVCNPLGFVFLDPSMGAMAIQIFVMALIVAVSYLVLWHYSRGMNWARFLVLVTSVIALLNLFIFPSATAGQRAVLILEAFLGGASLSSGVG